MSIDDVQPDLPSFYNPTETAFVPQPAESLEAIYATIQRQGAGENGESIAEQFAQVTQTILRRETEKSSSLGVNVLREQDNWALQLFRNEYSAWRLLEMLERDAQQQQHELLRLQSVDPITALSHQRAANELFIADSNYRRQRVVVQWLQRISAELDAPSHEMLDTSEKDKPFTFREVQQRTPSERANSSLVGELDPDALVRESLLHKRQKRIHEKDQAANDVLLKQLWKYARCGQLEDAKQTCRTVGQHWRAATLSGGSLYEPPKTGAASGNMYRSVWKMACLSIAKSTANIHEKALYALLADDLEDVLPACQSWEDYLWAYLHVIVESKIDREIDSMRNAHCDFAYPSMERGAKENRSLFSRPAVDASTESVFDALKVSPNAQVRDACAEKFHVVQEYLILGKFDQLFDLLAQWCKEEQLAAYPSIRRHFVRFAAHFALYFFRDVELSEQHAAINSTLVDYIELLIESGKAEFTALYTARLPNSSRVEVYSRLLSRVVATEQRRALLSAAQEMGLDVYAIARRTVEIIRELTEDASIVGASTAMKPAPGQLFVDPSLVDEKDSRRIGAIEFLRFDPRQCVEALLQGNAIVSSFLLRGKTAAAQQAFESLNVAALQHELREVQQQGRSDEIELSEREFKHYVALVDALGAFDKWRMHHFGEKPREPVKPTEGEPFVFFRYERELTSYKADITKWKSLDGALSNKAARLLARTIGIENADGVWLSIDNPSRKQVLAALRKIYVPRMFGLLYEVLQQSKKFEDCIDLANALADSELELHEEFNRAQMQEMLVLFRETSISLLGNKLDAYGFH
jgi:nuclear pore complex protein Nup107